MDAAQQLNTQKIEHQLLNEVVTYFEYIVSLLAIGQKKLWKCLK
jgi:hypothetical protein